MRMSHLFNNSGCRKTEPTISFLSLQFYHCIMNGLHRSSLHHLWVLLMIISGSALPAIDYARYRNGKISENLTSSRDSADDRMQLTGHPIKVLPQREHPVVDLPVSLNKGENEISNPSPHEPGNCKLPANLFQNG